MDSYIKVPCIKIEQPIGDFYIGKMDYKDILKISYSDVRRIEKNLRDVEEYIGIQRELSQKRVREIGQYVNLVDASFPNSIILSISSNNVEYINTNNESTLEILDKEHVAKVLDGQHRIAGLEAFNQTNKKFELIVSIFIDMEIEDQALIFATINQTQTKVNKSLVADLYEFSKFRSPQKTCHNIARALNEKPENPFYDKIKILGSAENKEKETITQSTFVENLIVYITDDRTRDRDNLKIGKKLFSEHDRMKYFLRDLFILEKDYIIAKLISNYFKAVQRKWSKSWDEVRPEMILNRSTGFIALMRFLKDVCLYLGFKNNEIDVESFSKLFEKSKLLDDDFSKTKYVPGSTGQTQLYNDLLKIIR